MNFYPTVKGVDLKVNKTEISVISANSATLYAEYIQVTDLQAGYQFTLDGAMTILLEKGRRWRLEIPDRA